MTKKKKIIIGIVSAAIAVVLIASLIIALVINNNRSKTPTSVMTCSVNPEIQFVLNAKNEVMQVVSLNNDGQAITTKVEFVGLAAEMFVKISTEAGYINPETTGTAVNFDLSGDKKNYDKLKEKIVSQVNAYFDEKGIIAGAVAKVTEDFKEAIKTLKPSATNLENKSQKELMEHYLEITELVKDVRPDNLEGFYNIYDKAIEDYNKAVADTESKIAECQQKINDYKAQLEGLSSLLPQFKEIEALIADQEAIINNYNKFAFSDALNAYNKTLNDYLSLERQNYSKFIADLKSTIETKISNTASILEGHKTYFEAHRSEVETAIANFRATLNA